MFQTEYRWETMKVVLVAAVLLAVAHVGDAHDEAIPETHCESLVVLLLSVNLPIYTPRTRYRMLL